MERFDLTPEDRDAMDRIGDEVRGLLDQSVDGSADESVVEFESGVEYEFNPPVTTNAMPVSGGEWTQKTFTSGWCLGKRGNVWVFQGKSVGSRIECYFHVEYGGGSIADPGDTLY